MKRNILTLLIALLALQQTVAQTYDNLWKQAEIIAQKDQPKSEIAVMKKIIAKASAANDYGQLLAAEMRQMTLWKEISADSLEPNVKRMEAEVLKEKNPVLKAVRYAVLGKVSEKKSQEFFKKALEQPELLARHTSTEYVPLTQKGVDGSSFNNDLLHLIGFEADSKEAYLQLYTYYNKVGNRGAACLCAYKLIEKYRQDDVREVKKSKYLQTIDSLIQVYQDIPEAGELAVEHFRFMEGATDAKPQDKLNYINYALSRWGGWSRMNELRNAQKRLTEPMFQVQDMPKVLRPKEKVWVHLNVRNLQNLKFCISRLNITADNNYDAQNEATYKMLLKKTTKLHQKDFSRNYYGRPDYETVKDSIEIGGNLPLGAYLMEVTSDNTGIAPQRELFYVSNLAVMIQQLPDDRHRYVVVNATDGQPVPGAKIVLYDRNYDDKTGKFKRVIHARMTTDDQGEAYFKNVDGKVLIYTSADKFAPAKDIYLSRARYYEKKDDEVKYQLFTDRAIYRPGQKVHATAVSYIVKKGLDASVPGKSKELKFILRDANWKQV
ncbi:MAG: alpha-2-macroglobulin, partial [Segatella copri]